jgi:hypothetical protein
VKTDVKHRKIGHEKISRIKKRNMIFADHSEAYYLP